MKRQSWHVMALLLASASLTLSACQPLPATVAQPTALPPAGTAPQVAAVSSATPAATAAAQPTSNPQVRWAFETQGAIWGTATVNDGAVCIGSDDGHLYAVEAKSGQLKWEFESQGIVRSRPAIANGLAYFASDDGYLYAVDARNGKQAWRTDIGNVMPRERREKLGTNRPTDYDYMQSSPALAHGQVYVGSADGKVYALAADTGKINWTFQTGGRVRATPAVDGDTVYVGSWDLCVYALDARSGEMRWRTMIGGEVQTTALVAQGTVYCASRKASVVALDAQTGEKKWEYDYGTNMWVESSPRLVGGIVYIGSSGSMIVVGLDSQTGQAFTRLETNSFNWSTPAVEGDMLYIGGASARHANNGGLLAIKLVGGRFADGERFHWYLPVEGTLEASGEWSGVASSPVVVDGAIYFGGLDGRLYAVSDQGAH